MKSPIKWLGGKTYLTDIIKQRYINSGATRIVEPFAGSCAISFGIQTKSICCDINYQLINFYEQLQLGLIINEINIENTENNYYNNRNKFNERFTYQSKKYDAELFYYLNKHCYNGLYRVNKKNEFNVPYGKYKKPAFKTDLTEYANIVKDWQFLLQDFRVTLVNVKQDDFVYIDPPYVDSFISYSSHGFDWRDQIQLAEFAATIDVPFVLSNKATDATIELYSDMGFNIEYIDAPRRISCNGDRKPAREVLVSNY